MGQVMNLSQFAKLMRPENAEILVLDEKIAKVGEFSDFFISFFRMKNQLYSINVKYAMLPYDKLFSRDFHTERLFLNRYDSTERVGTRLQSA